MGQEQAGLGEQALNKIAEMALASQLEQAERLEVQVKTDPSKLARGEVEAIAIEGEGLVMQPDMSVAKLELQINQVAVKPFSALFGKIELTKPSEGSARIVITEDNLNQAFNSESFRAQLQQKQVIVEGQPATVKAQTIKSRLLADGKLAISTQLELIEPPQTVAFTATPCIDAKTHGIVLQQVTQTEGEEIPPEALRVLIEQVSQVLSLQDLELEGMTLQLQQLEVAEGKMVLQATASIEQFPSS